MIVLQFGVTGGLWHADTEPATAFQEAELWGTPNYLSSTAQTEDRSYLNVQIKSEFQFSNRRGLVQNAKIKTICMEIR